MLKVGDKVRVITRVHGIDQFGLEGILRDVRFGEFVYEVEFAEGRWPFNTYRDGELELIEDEPEIVAVPIPTPFLFVQEIPPGMGGKDKPFVIARQYPMLWLNSLEEAQEHCDRLKEIHGHHLDIHAYVRID